MFRKLTAFFHFFLFLFVSISLYAFDQNRNGKGIDPTNIDRSADPRIDFYQFAAGGWMKNHPIPDEYSSWGSFEILADNTARNVKSILEKATANHNWPKGSIEQKIGDFYAAAMDSARIERNGLKPLLPELAKINLVRNKKDLINFFSEEYLYGIRIPFNFYASIDARKSELMVASLSQGGITLPDVEYYTKDDERSRQIRERYNIYLVNMFKLAGDNEETAIKNAQTVLAIETRLAKASNTRLENRDPEKTYNKMAYNNLKKISGGFDWDLYFDGIGIEVPPVVVVGQPRFFEEVGKMIDEVDLNDWKVYVRWHMIHNAANFLSSDFVDERFEFFGKFLTGAKVLSPRWKRVNLVMNGGLGELVGQLYVAEYFPPEAKEKAKNIVANLLAAMEESINGLDWMSDATKKQALKKLSTFGVKIGYPDKWTDYSELEIKRDSYFNNIKRVNYWAAKENLKKIGQPVDKLEWAMSPQTVNAYYSSTRNEIVFPAAILQWPFFDPASDDAVNYGAMGAVIGHEITHGFDDRGRKYDVDGNLRDWWTKEDDLKFRERAELLVEQYNGYIAIDTFRVDGRLTLGENIGDLGGLTIAFAAFKKSEQYKNGAAIDGFTPTQRFFLAWAQIWANNIRDENLKLDLKTDVHSPGKFRVLGPLKNMPEFFEAFDVKPGDPMRNPADKIVKIW